MQVAVIDCGTNTFTMSLFETNASGAMQRIDKDRHFVELATEHLDRIGPLAFERALQAFRSFKTFLERYPKAVVRALGTAALRRASNSQALVDAVQEVSGITIEIIDGALEAQLIYQGVRQAAPLRAAPALIMDIGGGSVEFILANQEQIFWAKSYPIGLAVLYEGFQKSDPILPKHQQALRTFLTKTLADLLAILPDYKVEYFVGASGSFDMLEQLTGFRQEGDLHSYIDVGDFLAVSEQLVGSSLEQRLNIPNLKPTRARFSVMSVLLILFIQQQPAMRHLRHLIVSDHAMREGMVEQILQESIL